MDGRSATVAALSVAILGIVAFFVLEGVTAGLVLFVAGVLLVVIGIFGWQDREPALANATTGGTAMLDAPGGIDAEPADADDDRVNEVSGVPDDETADDEPRPVMEEAPPPHPAVGVSEAVADPLGGARTNSVLDGAPEPSEPESLAPTTSLADEAISDEPPPAPMMQKVDGSDEFDHVHDQPLLGHSDLVSHARDYHPEAATDGSTIQLRLLHERAHGAPHEIPPTLRPS